MTEPLVAVPSEWVEELSDLPIQLVAWDLTEPLPDDVAARVAAVIPPYLRPVPAITTLRTLPQLRLVQLLLAGYDHVLPHVPPHAALANARGVHDASTAELAVGLILTSLRGIDDAVRDAADHAWRPVTRTSLADRRVLMIGAGSVGAAIAARLAPFEVELTRLATHARQDEFGPVHAMDEVAQLLPQAEVVILIVPLTRTTRGMVDASFLSAMAPESLLVNLSRGAVVATDALVDALRDRRIHAALDVVDPEPLPPEHPLWTCPNLLLTPHLGGNSTAFHPRAVRLLRDQLTRLAQGQELRNVVRPAG